MQPRGPNLLHTQGPAHSGQISTNDPGGRGVVHTVQHNSLIESKTTQSNREPLYIFLTQAYRSTSPNIRALGRISHQLFKSVTVPFAVKGTGSRRMLSLGFEPHLSLHDVEYFDISRGIVNRMMSMAGHVLTPFELLEVFAHISFHPLEKRSKIRAAVPERTR
jgi:hypothetical protein